MHAGRAVRAALLALVWGVLLAPAPAAAEEPAVARANVQQKDHSEAAGLVFFLQTGETAGKGPGGGVAAVGAAHSFDLSALAGAAELAFRTGAEGDVVARSRRFLVAPGRAFHAPGATLRDDYLVFALDAPPRGARVLHVNDDFPRPGERVRILGVPSDRRQDEAVVYGRVHSITLTRIEIDLEAPADLRGWGGAPVLSASGDAVLGLLQAAWPTGGGKQRVGVSPIDGVIGALRKPLDGGRGRAFAAFAPTPSAATAKAAPPKPSPSAAKGTTRVAALPPKAAPEQPGRLALHVDIEYPENGAVIGNAAGVFVSGHAVALLGELRRFDVALVLDTSGSTNEPTGVDVNGNGVVGEPRLGGLGAFVGLGSTDPGDSILAAEVAAARRLLRGLDARSTRVAVITFAGLPPEAQGGLFNRNPAPAAATEQPLTTDYPRVEKALLRVRERGPNGMTHMAAGVDQATIELLGLRGSLSQADEDSEKIVLFFTDGQPTLPYQGFESDNVRAVLRAARRARRAGIRIHSFAIGPEALSGPIATVEMASITEGSFTPVRDPGALVNVVEAVNFANVESVSVRNTTLESDAHAVHTNPDGSWNALVPLQVGKNQLEVRVRASDGTEATRRLLVHYAPGEADPVLPRELVGQRNRLLEERLIQLRQDTEAAEQAAAEQARRQLAVEIERERAKAQERAAQQRKELEIEPDEPPSSP